MHFTTTRSGDNDCYWNYSGLCCWCETGQRNYGSKVSCTYTQCGVHYCSRYRQQGLDGEAIGGRM